MKIKEAKKKLEFQNIISILEKNLTSEIGVYYLNNLELHDSREKLKTEFSLIKEMSEFLDENSGYIWYGNGTLLYKLHERKTGEILFDGVDIFTIGQAISSCYSFNKKIGEEKYPLLKKMLPLTTELREFVDDIKKGISEKGKILDAASVELKRIRKSIHSLRKNIENTLRRKLNSLIKDKISMEDIITERSGRYVISIVAGRWNSKNYILHDRSSTGTSLFVEPVSIMELNNELSSLVLMEKEEIKRIIARFNETIIENTEDIRTLLELSGKLDSIQARAKLISINGWSIPQISENNKMDLIKASHPLLKKSIPISLEFGEKESHIVISGANAGGKTVSLKTFGIFALMFQSAIPLPCHPDSSLPVFDNILVDIGDEQSLENDLSTFSAHVVSMKKIIDSLNTEELTLILLDELGVGSNPRQGSALACAILEKLQEFNCMSMITTHYETLIEFASRLEKAENCAVKFDPDLIKPLYSLEKGRSGISHSFKIAGLYGFSDEIIERARSFMGTEEIKLDKLTEALELKESQLEKEKKKLANATKRMKEMKKQFKEEVNLLKRKQNIAKKEVAEEIKRDIRKTMDKMDELVKTAANDAEKMNRSSLRGELKRLTENIKDKIEIKEEITIDNKDRIDGKIGENIIFGNTNMHGTITDVCDRNRFKIELFSGLSMEVDGKDLRKGKETGEQSFVKISMERKYNISNEIDIRGKRAHEGVKIVEKYIEDAKLGNLKEVRIIHGKGTMKLAEAVSDYLEHYAPVKSFRKAKWGDGDYGVTIVEL